MARPAPRPASSGNGQRVIDWNVSAGRQRHHNTSAGRRQRSDRGRRAVVSATANKRCHRRKQPEASPNAQSYIIPVGAKHTRKDSHCPRRIMDRRPLSIRNPRLNPCRLAFPPDRRGNRRTAPRTQTAVHTQRSLRFSSFLAPVCQHFVKCYGFDVAIAAARSLTCHVSPSK